MLDMKWVLVEGTRVRVRVRVLRWVPWIEKDVNLLLWVWEVVLVLLLWWW